MWPFSKQVSLLLLSASSALAPFQCAHEAEPDYAIEETPGDALWTLAEEQKARGDKAARQQTLEFLVRRYPNSRFAEMAKEELGQRSE